MIVGIPKETTDAERRVAMVPDLVGALLRKGLEVVVQTGAGSSAGYPDAAYQKQGASIADEVLERADIIVKVQPPTLDEIDRIKSGAVLIGLLRPHANAEGIRAFARRSIMALAMELMPRITRAQPMDALSAMSTVAGYKAVLLAADRLPRFFPLLMTAAGTIKPTHVLIIGAGVAGLQAIGTARRLGAIVSAYDTRPAVKEQIESLGAVSIDLGLETERAEAHTGYAVAQTDEFYRKQRERLSAHLAKTDVVITTALVPGQPAPLLITEEMVRNMRPGSVIVDLAAEQGGNCALTEPGGEVTRHDVVIIGLLNLPGMVPYHASQTYAQTVANFLLYLYKDGSFNIDMNDGLTRATLVTHQGKILFSNG
jgi:proton-translocating NAD(P)+ transhydrogenase subunit alpha